VCASRLKQPKFNKFKALGIDLGNGSYKPGVFIEAEISAYEMQLLQNAEIEL
jgi:hypothetical protein